MMRDCVLLRPVAVHYHQQPKGCAQTKQHKTLLGHRVLRIIEQQGALIGKDRNRFLEADTVPPRVRRRLAGIPLEMQIVHDGMYIHCTDWRKGWGEST
jgi:hypothetical protein